MTRSERKEAKRLLEHLTEICERLRIGEVEALEHLEHVEGWRAKPVEDVVAEIEKLAEHLMSERGTTGENQGYAAFAAAPRIVERLRNAYSLDERERWPVGNLRAQWTQFEQQLLSDPEATAPEPTL